MRVFYKNSHRELINIFAVHQEIIRDVLVLSIFISHHIIPSFSKITGITNNKKTSNRGFFILFSQLLLTIKLRFKVIYHSCILSAN